MSRREFLSSDSRFKVCVGWETLTGNFFMQIFEFVPGLGYNSKMTWTSLENWGDRPAMTLDDISDTLRTLRFPHPPSLMSDLARDRDENSGIFHSY